MKNYFLSIAALFLFFGNIFAQQPAACGTNITAEQMQAFYNRDISHLQSKATKQVVYIPITYHLVADDNGSGAFTMNSLVNLHCSLNEDYADANVVFYINDIVTHNSSYYYYMQDSYAGDSMFLRRNVSNTCNIYLVKEAKSGSTPVCGYSYLAAYGNYLNRNGIMLNMSCSGLGSTTLTHEMGHYLNLPHTFSGWEGRDYIASPIALSQREKVDGTNCLTKGDGFCDTPPDYISDRWNCVSSKTFIDPSGTSFIVDEKNFMSYSADNCQQYFKPQQQAEVNAAAGLYRPYLLNLPVPNVAAVPTAQLAYPEDLAKNLSTSNMFMAWDAVPEADYYLVQFSLTSNFLNPIIEKVVSTNTMVIDDLSANKQYKWRVLAFTYGNICGDFSDVRTFNTFGASTSIQSQNVLCVNEGNGTATVSSNLSGINYVWSVLNETTLTFEQVQITTNNTLNNLTPGVYQVIVTDNSGTNATSFFTIKNPEEMDINIVKNGEVLNATVTGGNAPYSYTWSNGTSTVINYNPNLGSNSLYVIDANGCFQSAEFIYDKNTAINELASTELLLLYPNPVVGKTLNVKFISSIENATDFKLISITGQELTRQFQEIKVGENNFSIRLDGFSKGVYFLQFRHQNNLITRKVIL